VLGVVDIRATRRGPSRLINVVVAVAVALLVAGARLDTTLPLDDGPAAHPAYTIGLLGGCVSESMIAMLLNRRAARAVPAPCYRGFV
jgi:hypothetical protein